MMHVLELMKSHVIKASPGITLQDAVDMMDLYQVNDLPLVDDEERLVGIVTEEGIAEALLPALGITGVHQDFARFGSDPVEALAARPPQSIDERADVLYAAKLMHDQQLPRIPVTSEGRLVGTISRIDICQALLEGQIDPPA